MKKVNGLEKEENNVREITLGSLFDGTGGFPLAACGCGIRPVWASEISPFCIDVREQRGGSGGRAYYGPDCRMCQFI